MFSPRMWRCFLLHRSCQEQECVFSTHVEMFLDARLQPHVRFSFLHACGDVSPVFAVAFNNETFSPRMWRCFYDCAALPAERKVFSTHVEMCPQNRLMRLQNLRFLHACGDVSLTL